MKKLQEIKIDIVQGRKPYYVYLLYKPDGIPFYVGKGKSNRICAHESETRSFIKGRTWIGINQFKLNTIKKIWDLEQQVFYDIDSWHDNSEDAGNREIDLVFQIGRRIFNEGPLVNIRDGGNVWSEETRQMFSEKMKQYWSDPQTRQMFSEKMKRYWSDHPEMKKFISDSMISYIEQHPEFIDNLQNGKDHWIKNYPEEYREAEEKRLEICKSQEHRDLQSRITKQYLLDNPEQIKRIRKQGTEFWIENDEAREQARERAIYNKSHEGIVNWLAEVAPEILLRKHEKHSEKMKDWYQENPDQVEKMIENRNEILRSDVHRSKMATKTSDYLRLHPEVVVARINSMKAAIQELKKTRMHGLGIVRDKLVLAGEIKFMEPTENRLVKWKKSGLIKKYFNDFPVDRAKLEQWKTFINKYQKEDC